MSTETPYEKIEAELYTWLRKVFENPQKIVGNISQDSKNAYTLCLAGCQSPVPLIGKIELGNNSYEKLEEIKLKILCEYAKNPKISGIRSNKLNKEEKDTLKEEIKRYREPLKHQIEPYDNVWEQLINISHTT